MAQENVALSHPLPYSAQNLPVALSVEEQIVRLINRDFFAQTSGVKDLYRWLNEQRKYKSFGVVTGAQGVGKSVGLESYPKKLKGDRKLRSVPLYALYLEVFPTWGIRDICIRILELLNHGDRKGKTRNLLLRTWEALKEFGVEILIVDHADCLKRQAVLGMIRLSLRKETKISLILAGSTDLEAKLINQNLDEYFEGFREFSPLSLNEFSDVLIEHFAEKFLKLADPTNLFDTDIMEALYTASQIKGTQQCIFRHLVNILVKVIVQSSENQPSLCIDKVVLQQVLDGYMQSNRVLPELPGEVEDATA